MEFDFSKAGVVESLDTIPTDFRGLYKQDGDKFKLDSDHPGVKSAVVAITGLNTALRAARQEARNAQGRVVDLSPLADYGDSPEKILEGFQAKLADIKKAKGAEDVEKAVKQARDGLQAEHKKVVEALTAQNQVLTGQLHSLLIGTAATSALLKADAVDVDLVLPHVVRQIKAVDVDGKIGVVVVDETGDPRFSVASGKHLTIEELVLEMRGNKKFAPLFKSTAPSGGGGRPSQRTGVGGEPANRSATQKIADGLRNSSAVRRGRE